MGGKEEKGKVEEGSGSLICQNVVAPLPQGQKLGMSGHRGHQWIMTQRHVTLKYLPACGYNRGVIIHWCPRCPVETNG